MRILSISTVFPNDKQETLGVFVKERLQRLTSHCEVRVIAPVPWFPLIALLKKNYRPSVQKSGRFGALDVYYPKFFSFPGIFKSLDGFFLFLSLWRKAAKIKRNFDFDIIDAHFAYPEGFAATLLGKVLGKPVTITLRGTIVPLSKYALRRREIQFALRNSSKIFSVSNSLKNKACELGIHPGKIVVVSNGVDSGKFYPLPKEEARQALQLPLQKKIILSVGGLSKRKGYHRVISVLPQVLEEVPDAYYVIVGGPSVEGDMSAELETLVGSLNLQDNVHFAGACRHTELNTWYNAADLFCLATSNEGWANVLMESLACGVPVIATRVGGNAEIVNDSELGILVELDQPLELANALVRALNKEWDEGKIRRYTSEHTWEKAAGKLMNQFEMLDNNHKIPQKVLSRMLPAGDES